MFLLYTVHVTLSIWQALWLMSAAVKCVNTAAAAIDSESFLCVQVSIGTIGYEKDMKQLTVLAAGAQTEISTRSCSHACKAVQTDRKSTFSAGQGT